MALNKLTNNVSLIDIINKSNETVDTVNNDNVARVSTWIKESYTILDGYISNQVRTLSLSNYLPDDGCNYEVLIEAYTVAPINTYHLVSIGSSLIDYLPFFAQNNNTNEELTQNSILAIPVGADRNIKVLGTQWLSTNVILRLYARGYRKIYDDVYVDQHLSNISNNAKSLIANMGMPSDTYINLELGISGTKYTAPADGWVWFAKQVNSYENKFAEMVAVYPDNSPIYSCRVYAASTSDSTAHCVFCLPIRKNYQFYVSYNADGSLGFFRFIYAVGSEHEAE